MEQTSNIPSFEGANSTAGMHHFVSNISSLRFDQAVQSDHLQDLGQGSGQDGSNRCSATSIRPQWKILEGKFASLL